MFFFGDTLTSNKIPFGGMSYNMSFIFNRPIMCKTLIYIEQLDCIYWWVLSFDTLRFSRLVADWSVENVNPDVNVSPKKLEAQWAEHVSLTFQSALRKLNTEPFIGASHQISVHLAKQFQRRRLFNQSETRIACGCHVC